MSRNQTAARSVFIMIIFGLGSKLLGFLREMLIAAKFGSSMETDTYFIVLIATSLFTTLLMQSLSTTLIPVMAIIGEREGKRRKYNHINNLLNIVIVVSLVIVVLAWPLSPLIIKILAYGFKGSQFDLAVQMMRIGMPALIFAGIVGVYRGYLQSELLFIESAATQLPFNMIYIAFLIFLSGYFGIKGLIVASVLAVGSQILIQLPGLKKSGYKYRFSLDFRDQYIKKTFYLILPVIISIAVYDLNYIVDRSLASTLIEGSISALNYSNRINDFVLSIFITAVTTVFFPMFSCETAKGSHENLKKLVNNAFNVILLIIIPSAVGIIILTQPIVRIAFERGEFDAAATQMTSLALLFYSLGLVGMALRPLTDRIYYSLQDTKTPMYNSILTVSLNVILNIVLIKSMAHSGLALATSISVTVTTGLLIYKLKDRIGNLGLSKLAKCGLKSLFASLVMGIIVYLAYYSLESKVLGNTILELAVLLGVASLGAVVYFGIIYLLKVEEIGWFVDLFKKKLKDARIKSNLFLK